MMPGNAGKPEQGTSTGSKQAALSGSNTSTGELQKIEGLLKEGGCWIENKYYRIKKYS